MTDLDTVVAFTQWCNEGCKRNPCSCGSMDATDAAGRVRAVLRTIAVQGGPGHWTWPLIDGLAGQGACARWYDEAEAEREREADALLAQYGDKP